MNQVLELKDPKILGEEHPTYGFSFWSETDGDYPVMFNSKEGNILPGTRVTYETAELKTSSKGNEYLRLKKVKFEDNPEQTSAPFAQKSKPTFQKADDAQAKKDNQITKNMVWKNLLQVYDVASMTPDSRQWEEFWANVELHTEMLTVGNLDRLGGSYENAVPTPSSRPIKEEKLTPATTKSLGAQFRARNPEDGMTAGEIDYTDEEIEAMNG